MVRVSTNTNGATNENIKPTFKAGINCDNAVNK